MSTTRDYALAPALRARLMGALLAGVGLLLLVGTFVVAVVGLPGDILTALVVAVVVAIFGLGFLLVRRWYVVRLDASGYQVRFVRGAGVRGARWTDVHDLATTTVDGDDCVVLRLRSGDSTTIPVGVIEGDREEFVRELRRRLGAAHR